MKQGTTILDVVGETPLIRLNRISRNAKTEVYLKLEYVNPSGSTKDRIVKRMFEDAEKQGRLKPGSVVIDATTGSHGIASSMTCAAKGYKMIVVMPSKINDDVKKIMSAYGAELVFVEGGEEVMEQCIEKVQELVKQYGNAWVPGQFTNPGNVEAHRMTGQEILEQMDGDVDVFVAGLGTSGTLTGVSTTLKEHNEQLMVVAVEPEESPVLSGGEAGCHGIYGIGDGIIPPLYKKELVDKIVTVSTEEAVRMAQRLTREEGIFCGPSSGANVHASLLVAREFEDKKKIVTMIVDTGMKYLSTNLVEEK